MTSSEVTIVCARKSAKMMMNMCFDGGLPANWRNERRERYTIPQEEEIDQKERTDLRAENPRTAPVTIELKWADNWTLSKLLERLENQLVGQYLRAVRSRYGIYVLATDGRQGHWKSPDGNLVFDQVIERIVRRADELRRTCPGVNDLRVVAIDFRPPASS
jgi:hypothetical protein